MVERRREQLFPVFTPAQVAVARRFGGEPQRFKPREVVFGLGQTGTPAYLVLSGAIDVARRNAGGDLSEVTTHGPGEITGEISQLAGGPSLAQGCAGPDGAEAVPFDAAQLRALVVGCAEVSEAVMRALILRRMLLIEAGAGMVLLGPGEAPETLRLQHFLRRNAVPYSVLDPQEDAQADQLIQRLAISRAELPVALCPDGTLLRNPNERELAQCLGLLPSHLEDRLYDVAIVGAGPAGLAAAVYAASEGLAVVVFDSQSFGGQAGTSSRIENYLGFPTGISGEALAGRAYAQAQKFGATMAIPVEITVLEPRADVPGSGRRFELTLNQGAPVHATAIVIATGARYRRLDLPNLSDFEGRDVHYWASPIESKLCSRREVVVVGGGNSAGQGTVFLAQHASQVHLLVRGRDLGESMSQYLVDRIKALRNVAVHVETELTRLVGDHTRGLQSVCWRERRQMSEECHPIRHVFCFIGAVPNTEWLTRCAVRVDDKGFVQTGEVAMQDEPDTRQRPLSFETSQRGVFAIGDVRAGSVKRVSAAVGEGAALVAQLHVHVQASRQHAGAGLASVPGSMPA